MGLSFGPGGTAQRPFTHRDQVRWLRVSLPCSGHTTEVWGWRGTPTPQCSANRGLLSTACSAVPGHAYHPAQGCSTHSVERTTAGRKGALEGAHLLPPSLTGLRHCTGSCFCGALCKETESFLSPCHVGVAATAHPTTEHPQGKRGDSWKHTRHLRTGPPGHLLNNSSGSTGLRARALWKCSPLEEFVILHST